MTENHEFFMQQCLELASQGQGMVEPNPMVGCLIVHHGKVVAKGFHQKFGGPHAEVNAVNSLLDKSVIHECIVYVNLEPCSHFGKTPPCALMLADLKPAKVIIAMQDPNPLVSGKGIKILEDAGIEVLVGVLENEALDLNRRFITFHSQKRPFIILKWAQTLDGFIDIDRSSPQLPLDNWITNHEMKILVHKWRTQEQAIVVGRNTVINDDPALTARLVLGRQPIPFIITTSSSIPLQSKLLNHPQTPVLMGEKPMDDQLRVLFLPFENDFFEVFSRYCYEKGILSVLIEGGKQLLEYFILSDRWDEARVLVGNKNFSIGLPAPLIPDLYFKLRTKVDDNYWDLYRNTR